MVAFLITGTLQLYCSTKTQSITRTVPVRFFSFVVVSCLFIMCNSLKTQIKLFLTLNSKITSMLVYNVYYLFNIHHLRLIDFCNTDVVFGSNGESSLKKGLILLPESKHWCLSAQSMLCNALPQLRLCEVLSFDLNPINKLDKNVGTTKKGRVRGWGKGGTDLMILICDPGSVNLRSCHENCYCCWWNTVEYLLYSSYHVCVNIDGSI